MKVLHLGKYFPPEVYGGVESVNHSLMSAGLDAYDQMDCLVFGLNNEGVTEFSSGKSVYYCKRDVLIRSAPVSFSYVSRWFKLFDQYDVVHLHYPNPLAEICVALRPPTGKLVVHWHSDVVNQLVLKRLISPITRKMLRLASRIVCTSERYAQSSLDLEEFQSKVEVIPIGVKPLPKSDPAEIASLRKEYRDKKLIFSLGRLIPYKGFQYLISSARFLGDDYIVVIGGEGELGPSLRLMAENLGVSDRVKFLGRLSDERVILHFNACDVFCLPSITRAEAFGVVQAEAMSVGAPIVSTDIEGSGVPWVNQNGVSGVVVPPRSDAELAVGIRSAVSLQLELSDGATKRYQECFTEERMHRKFAKLYSELLGS